MLARISSAVCPGERLRFRVLHFDEAGRHLELVRPPMRATPQPGPWCEYAPERAARLDEPSRPIPADLPYNIDGGERVRMKRRWVIVSASYIRVACAVAFALTLMVSSVATQPQTNPTAATLADFGTRIKAYVELHRKLANETGEIDETKSPRQITDREVALGKLIRTARAQARRGDIFAPPIEALFKQLIREESARRSPRVRTDRKEDQDELADFTPTVNQVYPPTQPLVTFPAGLLRVLPKLPRELEYRLVQRNLILRDIEANVIIDFIPAATP